MAVFFCNMVVANYKGFLTMVKQDEYGFTLVNFDLLIPLSAQSFTFTTTKGVLVH
jgi:hypothetical protein